MPVTVLSRCQRFDLRRIPAEKLAAHFGLVSKAEGVEVEAEALGMIARAAEGSARDGLSILDQAIAHGAGAVTAIQVRDMLGLADRGRIRRLLQLVLNGDAAAALTELDEAHDLGIDPTQLLRGLMESLHSATRAKASASADPLLSAEERESAAEMARQLSWGTIHRLWQMLLKGLQDVEVAPDPREAAEMALLRLIHAADMPDPASLVAKLTGRALPSGRRPCLLRRHPYQPPAFRPISPASSKPWNEWQTFVGAAAPRPGGGGALCPAGARFEAGSNPWAGDWPRQLGMELKALTGTSWQVSFSDEPGEPSLLDQEKMAEERVRSDVLADPNVRAVMDVFPDSELNPSHPEAPDMPEMPDFDSIMQMAQNAQAELRRRRTISTRSRSRARQVAGWSRSAPPPRAGSSLSISTRLCCSHRRRRWSRTWSPPRVAIAANARAHPVLVRPLGKMRNRPPAPVRRRAPWHGRQQQHPVGTKAGGQRTASLTFNRVRLSQGGRAGERSQHININDRGGCGHGLS